MYKEIGSEFWSAEPTKNDKLFVLSGRTALELIIRDILKSHTIRSALLPSYCCHTMVEPFYRNGISVRFYDVFWNGENGLSADIPDIDTNEVFYSIKYFGFEKFCGVPYERICRDAEVIIEDQTHSWLTEHFFDGADYSFASYRKWTGLSGVAGVSKKYGSFSEFPVNTNEKYIALRKRAAAMKKDYIEKSVGDKQNFLSIFVEAESMLENDYVGYLPDSDALIRFFNIDADKLKKARRQNAQTLINGLKNVCEIRLMFSKMSDTDVPLFVPIIVPTGRTELRRHLADNSIYCPIHWPRSAYHDNISEKAGDLYERELSLVCDQRYDESDMLKMIRVICDYYKE